MYAFVSPTPIGASRSFTTNATDLLCSQPKSGRVFRVAMVAANPGEATRRIVDGGITSPLGFRAGGATAGFKPSGLPDLAVVVPKNPAGAPATGAAVYTKCLVRAAPVDLAESHMATTGGRVAAIVVNSGQANAATGAVGATAALETAQLTADTLGCAVEEVLVASTGVIGVPFDMAKMKDALPQLLTKTTSLGDKDLASGGGEAAKAIMTTDLAPKQAAFEASIDGAVVKVGGMAKGSGMIHPNMATMLGFVTCDAAVEQGLWQSMVSRATDKSFNAITVDGDTSTNDVLFALCGGESGVTVTDPDSEAAAAVEHILTETCVELAKRIARDGEGSTVLTEIVVSGAQSDEDARTIARNVAGSSLVKAAIFGRDPNWGRISAAAGNAGVPVKPSLMCITLGDQTLFRNGTPTDFDKAAASAYMKSKANASPQDYCSPADTVVIKVTVGDGPGVGNAWGCDLSYKYVEINSEYTT